MPFFAGEWLKFANQALGWSKASWSVGTRRGPLLPPAYHTASHTS